MALNFIYSSDFYKFLAATWNKLRQILIIVLGMFCVERAVIGIGPGPGVE